MTQTCNIRRHENVDIADAGTEFQQRKDREDVAATVEKELSDKHMMARKRVFFLPMLK